MREYIYDYSVLLKFMLWIKSFHIIFMVTWFAGLFYLPRLFVYHSMAQDKLSLDRFVVMERKLLYGIMTPGAVLTIAFGFWLMFQYNFSGIWLHLKILCVVLLCIYHLYCFKYFFNLRDKKNRHTHVFFRWFNEIPVVFLFIIILLVVFKPL